MQLSWQWLRRTYQLRSDMSQSATAPPSTPISRNVMASTPTKSNMSAISRAFKNATQRSKRRGRKGTRSKIASASSPAPWIMRNVSMPILPIAASANSGRDRMAQYQLFGCRTISRPDQRYIAPRPMRSAHSGLMLEKNFILARGLFLRKTLQFRGEFLAVKTPHREHLAVQNDRGRREYHVFLNHLLTFRGRDLNLAMRHVRPVLLDGLPILLELLADLASGRGKHIQRDRFHTPELYMRSERLQSRLSPRARKIGRAH